tara:strand:+ start:1664 stop:2047 length:384 start_codon:yes stop_codon:yes gene_type:complete
MDKWYDNLNKAPWTPPSWVFGVVWSILYAFMTLSLFLVWTNKKCFPFCKELVYFFIQLFFNLMWTPLFFQYKMPQLALLDLMATYLFTYLTYEQFNKINKFAAFLLIPYLAWLSLAFTLNLYIVLNN